MFCLQRTRQQVRPRRDVSRKLGLSLTRSSPQSEGLFMGTFSGIRTVARMGVDILLEVAVLTHIKCKKSQCIGVVWIIVLIRSYIRIESSHTERALWLNWKVCRTDCPRGLTTIRLLSHGELALADLRRCYSVCPIWTARSLAMPRKLERQSARHTVRFFLGFFCIS